jgi:hypothetical protein
MAGEIEQGKPFPTIRSMPLTASVRASNGRASLQNAVPVGRLVHADFRRLHHEYRSEREVA